MGALLIFPGITAPFYAYMGGLGLALLSVLTKQIKNNIFASQGSYTGPFLMFSSTGEVCTLWIPTTIYGWMRDFTLNAIYTKGIIMIVLQYLHSHPEVLWAPCRVFPGITAPFYAYMCGLGLGLH